MPVRRRGAARLEARIVDPLTAFFGPSDNGLDTWFDEPAYQTRAEAERAWKVHRRAVWAHCYRFSLPGPAKFYDGLTTSGWDFLWSRWNHIGPFDLKGALAALAADHAALLHFEQHDPRGAQQIADYLELLRADLATVERLARELGAHPGPDWQRPSPCFAMSSGNTYGNVPAYHFGAP